MFRPSPFLYTLFPRISILSIFNVKKEMKIDFFFKKNDLKTLLKEKLVIIGYKNIMKAGGNILHQH